MNARTGTMRIAPIKRIFVCHGLAHFRVEAGEVIQGGEIWFNVGVVAHSDKVQQNHFQWRIPGSLSFAQTGPVYNRTTVPNGRDAVRDDKAGIVMRMKLEVGRVQPGGPQGLE